MNMFIHMSQILRWPVAEF